MCTYLLLKSRNAPASTKARKFPQLYHFPAIFYSLTLIFCLLLLVTSSSTIYLVSPITPWRSQEFKQGYSKRNILCHGDSTICGEEVEPVGHLFLPHRITTQLWRIFINLRGVVWTMPNRITHLLYSWEEAGGELQTEIDGGLSQPVSGRQSGEREMLDVLRAKVDLQKIKLNCIKLFCFWCKQMYLEDTESIIEIFGSI
ncbi:hypothetical protein H5410_007052 [Solanum commersonii]|uniref:Uncharacterized protein n=1 Tax=Solanum commersonii TaxID=4109 RepID=A0A9J6ACD3_SOLCO|nr:hypothetical protein H5410_007052 [Solanum commersonii]